MATVPAGAGDTKRNRNRSRCPPPGTLKAYGTYWKRVVDRWGSRHLDEPSPLEIERFGKELRASRVQRRDGRGGSGVEENYVAAMRCLYKRAVVNDHIAQADNSAARVAKPRRQPSARHALREDRLEKINHVAATTGDDPEPDSLILRLHQETAGAVASSGPQDHFPQDFLRDRTSGLT